MGEDKSVRINKKMESAAPALHVQQYPTLSSGYTQNLARQAIACSVQKAIRAANACCPQQPLKIQAQSGTYLQSKLDGACYKFKPQIPNSTGGNCGLVLGPSGEYISVQRPPVLLTGISAGGLSESARISQLIDATSTGPQGQFVDFARRFEQYNGYVYPLPPCTTPVVQSPIPVPKDQLCPLPGVAVSGPNLVTSQPTAVIVTGLTGGNIEVTWTAGTDRSIVKYNIYINGGRIRTNVATTDVVLLEGWAIGFTGTVVIEPVARNNWRGIKSAPVNFTITI